MKRVLIEEPRTITIEETARPVRSKQEVLLKVHYAGICGSDLHTYQGTSPLAKYPVVPGHELCCEVLEADGELNPGDFVVVEPLLSCGRCYACRIGRYNCCEELRVLGVQTDGGMAEEIVLPRRLIHLLPRNGAPAFAPLVEMLSIGYHACDRGKTEAHDIVLVIGAGPIGLGAALVAKDKGATVGIIDQLEPRLRLSRELGIDYTFQAGDGVEPDVIAKFGSRPNVVVEAVGSPRTLEQGLEIVSFAGRVSFVGWTSQPFQMRPDLFLKKELDLVGSRNSSSLFPQVIDFYYRNLDKVKRLVTHRFKMSEFKRAMDFIEAHGSQAMKVIMEW